MPKLNLIRRINHNYHFYAWKWTCLYIYSPRHGLVNDLLGHMWHFLSGWLSHHVTRLLQPIMVDYEICDEWHQLRVLLRDNSWLASENTYVWATVIRIVIPWRSCWFFPCMALLGKSLMRDLLDLWMSFGLIVKLAEWEWSIALVYVSSAREV